MSEIDYSNAAPTAQTPPIKLDLPNATTETLGQLKAAIEDVLAESATLAERTAMFIRDQVASRRHFFERLVLVEGGTFALSLTYIAALGALRGGSTIPLGPLRFGWFALFASMFLAFAFDWVATAGPGWYSAASLVHQGSRQERSGSRLVRLLIELLKDGVIYEDGEPRPVMPREVVAAAPRIAGLGTNPDTKAKQIVDAGARAISVSQWLALASIFLSILAYAALGYFAFQTAPLFLRR